MKAVEAFAMRCLGQLWCEAATEENMYAFFRLIKVAQNQVSIADDEKIYPEGKDDWAEGALFCSTAD